ncbi:RNA-dependent RNA polymerase [Grapevine virus K]|uniref:RNA-dependent RNA polymerase n=1 Tax=Grapevine virus K TaxID=2016034 RepID=UPI000B5BA90A|nr:RNA-dependent RNA polymerase [Grapevine virus K]ASJ27579.1 RNA-dependent RNA polymerase [Grapevine virus K]
MSISVSSQRMAAASLYNNGDKDIVDQIKNMKTAALFREESQMDGLFDYYVEDDIRDFLSERGINFSVHSFRSHAHPISKILENYILYVLAPNYMREKVLIVSCKESKVRLLKLKHKKLEKSCEVYNRIVHAKDHFRYDLAERSRCIQLNKNFIRAERDCEDIFIHDEVQYWSLNEMQEFLGSLKKCTRVVYSIVYPAELDCGFHASIFPEAYDFEVKGDYFVWYPDGKSEGAYSQPVNKWLLSTSRTMDSEDRVWTITKLNSIGAHHLFACTLGGTISEECYEYSDSTVMHPLKSLSGLRNYRDFRLRTRMIRPVLLYLMALRKPDPESAVAKLRMLSHKSESMREALFVAQLAKQIRDTSLYDRMGNFDLKKAIKICVSSWIGDELTYVFDRDEFNASSLEKFIAGCDNVRVKIHRVFRDRVVMVHPVVMSDLEWHSDGSWEIAYIANLISMDHPREAYEMAGADVIEARTAVPITRVLRAQEMVSELSKREDVRINRRTYIVRVADLWKLSLYLIKINSVEYMTSRAIGYNWKPADLRCGYIDSEVYADILFGVRPTLSKAEKNEVVECADKACSCGKCTMLQVELDNADQEELLKMPLNDKLKNRSCAFYSRRSKEYKYVGGSHQSRGWSGLLDRVRAALKLDDTYDHCLVQKYAQDGQIGYHADDELCYLPGVSVVTLNLGGTCIFSVKCADGREQDNELQGLMALKMGPGCQQDHKHKVSKCSEGRMSLTFRNCTVDMSKDDSDDSDYEETKVDSEDILGRLERDKDFICSLKCIADHMHMDIPTCSALIAGKNPQVLNEIGRGGITLATLLGVCKTLNIDTVVYGKGSVAVRGSYKRLYVKVEEGHLEAGSEVPYACTIDAAMSLNPNMSSCSFKLDSKKARTLMESFQEGYTGVMLNRFKKGKHTPQEWEERVVPVWVSLGFAGSGKSHYVQSVLKNCEVEDVLVVSPRKNLAMDWSGKIRKGHKVVTLEQALSKNFTSYKTVVVDEVSLFPPGYLDLLCYMTRAERLIIMGDPLQCGYYNQDDEIVLEPIREDVFKRLWGKKTYLMYSHRLKPGKLFDIECYGEGVLAQPNEERPVICASRKAKEANKNGYTVSETQGLTFKFAVVQLDRDWALKDDGDVVVAFSRCRGDVQLRVSEPDKKYLTINAKSGMLKKFLVGERISRVDLCEAVRKRLDDVVFAFSEERLANSNEFEERLAGDPYLKSLMNILEEIEAEEIELPEVSAPEPMRTHLPLSTHSNELDAFELKAKEQREAFTNFGLTDQIDDKGYRDAPGPHTHKALYLRHESSDDATFMMSVKKRLRFRDMEANTRRYQQCEGIGPQLFRELKKTYRWMQPSSLPSLEHCDMDFLKKRMKKSAKLIERHAYRSSPDWPSSYLKVFLKNQTCTKLEKRGVDAKAGQTIACFCHSVLCRFGPKLRQTEKALKSMLPANVMIYSQKNYSDLDKWCKNFVNDFRGTDSDYEAFDRSQDEKILRLEVEVLKFFLWEDELIEEYVTLKLMMGCSLGNLAIMRFSGEFGTFFFNTIANMAFTCMRYQMSYNTPVCFAGDDMYSPGYLAQRHDFDETLDKLELKAKVNYGDKPLFCGWRMSPFGIVKEPNLILDRWKMAVGRGDLENCMVNYAIEAVYGYRLSEHLFELNIDIDAQQELTRLIVQVKDRLPPKIANLFSRDSTESWSDGEKDAIECTPEGELISS